jgi:hypothetical protein
MPAGLEAGRTPALTAGGVKQNPYRLELQFEGQDFALLRIKALFLAMVFHISLPSLPAAQTTPRQQEDAWANLMGLAEGMIGKAGLLDTREAEKKLDALVDLHAQFCGDVMGKPVPSERVFLVKQGVRFFFKTVAERYSGDQRAVPLQLLRDLAANRAVFVELFSSDNPAKTIEQQMFAYLEKNQNLSYTNSIPIDSQVFVRQTTEPLRIVAQGVRLVSDQGTSGHFNRAIDAGEIITLNIPLRNCHTNSFRSTSAILETSDAYVRANVSKVVYTERSLVNGDTVTFATNTTVIPSQHYSFSILPDCPDTHTVHFNLHVGDSDYGEFMLSFDVLVYNVGPLDFGTVRIDDDRFGDSDGNGNQKMDLGETIEYVLPLRNLGKVNITNVVATLFCSEPRVRFKAGTEECRYAVIIAEESKPRFIPASFVFSLPANDTNFPSQICLRLYTKGMARGYDYSWLRSQLHGVDDDKRRLQTSFEEARKKYEAAWKALDSNWIHYGGPEWARLRADGIRYAEEHDIEKGRAFFEAAVPRLAELKAKTEVEVRKRRPAFEKARKKYDTALESLDVNLMEERYVDVGTESSQLRAEAARFANGADLEGGKTFYENAARRLMELQDKAESKKLQFDGYAFVSGAKIQPLTADLVASLGFSGENGLIVTVVEKDSTAEKAGLRWGDIITHADSKPVNDLASLVKTVRRGGKHVLSVFRSGQLLKFEIESAARGRK